MSYLQNSITEEEELNYLQFLDTQEWDTTLKRRTQQYGFIYSYSKTSAYPQVTTPIPDIFQPLVRKLNDTYGRVFNQMIVNEYIPGQGISPHIDHTKFFGDTIVSITLGSGCAMVFSRGDIEKSLYLERRSAIVLTDEYRYQWKHSIHARKTDGARPRGRRVSLTFRTMI